MTEEEVIIIILYKFYINLLITFHYIHNSGRPGYGGRDGGYGGRDGGYGGGDRRGGYDGGDRRGGGGGGGVCYAFQKGSCDRGSSCKFSHN